MFLFFHPYRNLLLLFWYLIFSLSMGPCNLHLLDEKARTLFQLSAPIQEFLTRIRGAQELRELTENSLTKLKMFTQQKTPSFDRKEPIKWANLHQWQLWQRINIYIYDIQGMQTKSNQQKNQELKFKKQKFKNGAQSSIEGSWQKKYKCIKYF